MNNKTFQESTISEKALNLLSLYDMILHKEKQLETGLKVFNAELDTTFFSSELEFICKLIFLELGGQADEFERINIVEWFWEYEEGKITKPILIEKVQQIIIELQVPVKKPSSRLMGKLRQKRDEELKKNS